MKSPLLRILIPFLVVSLFPVWSSGGPTEEATQRMKDRISQIDALKASGSVGENQEGFLEVRSSIGPRQKSIVEAENADRLVIYTELSKRVGQSVESIGQQRAIRITKLSKSGVWLQKPDGSWYQKP